MKKKKKELLNILNKTRPRDIMPRPTTFKDKSKFDRNKVKKLTRNEENY